MYRNLMPKSEGSSKSYRVASPRMPPRLKRTINENLVVVIQRKGRRESGLPGSGRKFLMLCRSAANTINGQCRVAIIILNDDHTQEVFNTTFFVVAFKVGITITINEQQPNKRINI